MKTTVFLFVLICTLAQPAAANTASDGTLHPWETAIPVTGLVGEYASTSTIRFNLGQPVCVDRVEINVEARSGSPTVFIMGAEPNNSEPLDQDIHAGTITLPPASSGSHYRFRINRVSGQIFLLVGGGSVKVHTATAVIVPDYYCPLMANHQAPGWAKRARGAYKLGLNQYFVPSFRIFLQNLKVLADALTTVADGVLGFAPGRNRLPDTNPQVQKAALNLACLIEVAGLPESQIISQDMAVYRDVFVPLLDLRETIAGAYGVELAEVCPRNTQGAP